MLHTFDKERKNYTFDPYVDHQYREYLYAPDPTLLPNGCCESYPLDRDFWNNQLLDRNFLIDYGTVQHLKYPISEGICVGDRSVSRTKDCCKSQLQQQQQLQKNEKKEQDRPKIWTIEEQGLLDGISCQEARLQKEANYWLQNDGVGPCSPDQGNISQGLPLIPIEQSSIGQRLAYPILSGNYLSDSHSKNQCCPTAHKNTSVVKPALNLNLNLRISNLINNPGSVGNRRNVDAESALKGLNYLNNEDCYQNKICTDPLQANKSDLFRNYFQDNNCIYPNFTPKFWDNLTRAKSGTQLVTSKEYSKNALC